MLGTRITTLLTLAWLTMTDRARRRPDDRGSETVDKVLWIALTVVMVLAVYAVFNTKIVAKINSVDLG